jgi:hypothetical protein
MRREGESTAGCVQAEPETEHINICPTDGVHEGYQRGVLVGSMDRYGEEP